MNRCYNKNRERYPRYGGRGISVCERWHRFEDFLADMGARPDGTTLDRIDNDGNYEPSNCRWASPKQQRDNASQLRLYSYGGETKCVRDWCRQFGLVYRTAIHRLDRGIPFEQVITSYKAKA